MLQNVRNICLSEARSNSVHLQPFSVMCLGEINVKILVMVVRRQHKSRVYSNYRML
jgi:hypothetical protein